MKFCLLFLIFFFQNRLVVGSDELDDSTDDEKTAIQNIFCYVEGKIRKNRTLIGKLENCYPINVECKIASNAILMQKMKNIQCDANDSYDRFECSFNVFSRRTFCFNEQSSCYQVMMECHRRFPEHFRLQKLAIILIVLGFIAFCVIREVYHTGSVNISQLEKKWGRWDSVKYQESSETSGVAGISNEISV